MPGRGTATEAEMRHGLVVLGMLAAGPGDLTSTRGDRDPGAAATGLQPDPRRHRPVLDRHPAGRLQGRSAGRGPTYAFCQINPVDGADGPLV
jgi:hypothetical protein